MKILVTTSTNTKEIIHVYSVDYYLSKGRTMQQIEDAVLESNTKACGWVHQIVNVPDDMTETMKFLLGEDKYKTTATIRQLKDKVQNCIDDLEDMKSELYDMSNYFEEVARDLKKFAEDETKDD